MYVADTFFGAAAIAAGASPTFFLTWVASGFELPM